VLERPVYEQHTYRIVMGTLGHKAEGWLLDRR
jgi:hypothetical protein